MTGLRHLIRAERDLLEDADRRAHVHGLKDRVRCVLELDGDATVVVQELACRDSGCAPVETVVAVLRSGASPRQWTLPCPVVDIHADQLATVLLTRPSVAATRPLVVSDPSAATRPDSPPSHRET